MMAMFAPLLKTKLHLPSVTRKIVARQGLSEKLEGGLRGRLTLVAAPAGFGKTTLISAWASTLRHRIAWVSLDASDNDPALFWAYVITGFQTALSEQQAGFLDQIDPAHLPPPKTLSAYLINALEERAQKVILVLDDYHLISNQQIHQQLTYLIDNQPQTLHIVIATRADPPLPVARLRGHNLLNELRATDLRFTPAETAAYLNEAMGLDLMATEIAALEKRTEGWIIGLQLAALSMQNHPNKSGFVATFSGGHHYILEYLMDEIIRHLSTDLRSFLLQTAVLEQFNAALCNQVTRRQDSAALLTSLTHQNLFIIPLDNERCWFRYHHLFRDLLKNRLQQEFSTAHINQLYLRASQWHREANEPDEAIKYALLAQDFEQAADLIVQIVDPVIARGQINTLLHWIETLPAEVIRARPQLLMHQGWVTFLTGNVTQASQILQQAKRALTAIHQNEEKMLLHGKLSAMLATITALTPDLTSAIAEAEEALARLPKNQFIFRARALRAKGVSYMFLGALEQALSNLETAREMALSGENKFLAAEITAQIGTLRKHQGKLSLAQAAYQWILDLYTTPEQSPPACLGYIGLAEIALKRNEFSQADAYLNLGIELCQKGDIGYALQPAYLIGGLVKSALGDEQAARETIQLGENLSRQGGGSLESILGLAYFQTRLCLQLGELEKARQWVQGQRLPPNWTFDKLPLTLDEIHQSLRARVALACGEFEQVLAIAAQIIPQAAAGGRFGRVLELNLFRAQALWQLGKNEKALTSFEKCLTLAEPEGSLHLFLEQGEALIPLLETAIAQGVQAAFTTRILAAFPDHQDAVAAPQQFGLIEPLTTREMEVLTWICEGYANQKIAETLVVSVNTIKKHTSNIYSKLGVRNRAQAVLKAREINLI